MCNTVQTSVCMIVQHDYFRMVRLCVIMLSEVIGLGKTSAEVKNRYRDKAFDRIEVVVKKGGKDRLKQAAEEAGQSTNGFIRECLNKAVQDITGSPMEKGE